MVTEPDDLAALLDGVDVVAGCADHPTADDAAELVATACVPLRIPHTIAAYAGPVARVGPTWLPRRRPVACHGCLRLVREREDAELVDRPPRRRGGSSRAAPRSPSPRPSSSPRSPPRRSCTCAPASCRPPPGTSSRSTCAPCAPTGAGSRGSATAACAVPRCRSLREATDARPRDPARGGEGMTLRVKEVKRPRPAISRIGHTPSSLRPQWRKGEGERGDWGRPLTLHQRPTARAATR